MLQTILRITCLSFWIFSIGESSELKGQSSGLDQNASSIYSISNYILPAFDNEELRAKYDFYESSASSSLPHQFAESTKTELNCENHGTWESSKNGNMLWRQRITSKGAYSLNVGFTDFHLPSSGKLYIYDAAKTIIIGPITHIDNDEHGEWWSPIIPGDDIIIEVQVEKQELEKTRLEIGQVNHDFSGFGSVISGSCNLDVLCGESDGYSIVEKYRDVINSVGMMMIDGRFQCTGSLLNNVRKDCQPFVITAQHCGITSTNASSVLVYWNFQNSQCREPGSSASGNNGDGSKDNFNTGATFLAEYDQSDFALVLLDDPVDPSLSPYFLGWDRETETVDSAATVHHPSGGEKRISIDYDSLTFNVDRNFVRVGSWDIGTTEGGSSGAPIFDKSLRMIGHLSGGDAACGNALEDDFGMFKKSWEGGGTPETRLKDWLDPDNSGITVLNGRYCVDVAVLDVQRVDLCSTSNPSDTISIMVASGYKDGGSLSLSQPAPGINVAFSKDVIIENEQVDIYITVTDQANSGLNTINILLENDLGSSSFQIIVSVDMQSPDAVTNSSPSNGARDLDFDIPFDWSDNNNSLSYQIEISEHPDFETIFRTIEDIKESEITLGGFQELSTYYWRVKALNACGQSPYSSTTSFTTGTVVCQVYASVDIPLDIGLEPVTIISKIEVTESGTVADVNVKDILINHTWITDLSISLISPLGTEVLLIDSPCNGEDDMSASFDDESDIINIDCPITQQKTYKPTEALATLKSESAAGTWYLKVIDNVGEDGGALNSWSLDLCLNKSENKRFVINPAFIEICDKNIGDIIFDVELEGGWKNPSMPVVTTGSGISIGASVSPNPIGETTTISVSLEDPSSLLGQSKIAISISDDNEIFNSELQVIHTSEVNSPTLSIPSDLDDQIDLLPTLSWSSENDGISYQVIVASDPELEERVVDVTTSDKSLTLSTELEELTTYYWSVTAIDECRDQSSEIFSFVTDRKVATIDQALSKVRIYPSPVNDILKVDLSDISILGDITYQLYTLTGSKVMGGNVNQSVLSLSVGHLTDGLYLFQMQSEKGVFSHKIVISR